MWPLQHSFLRSLGFIAIYLCLRHALLADPSTLKSDSPFLPPGYSALKPIRPKPVQQPNSPVARDLEFKGVVQLDGSYQFSLFKKSENRSYWIAADSSEDGISITDFDRDGMLITIEVDGQSQQLALAAASENPLPVVTTSTANNAIPNPLPPAAQTQQKPRNNAAARRTIPRRRVIVPPKN